MSSPDFRNGSLLAALAVLLLTACTSRGPDGPSLLLVCADTVRADVFFNPEIDDALTPWLERSQRYTRTMTTAPWTLPAVASALTGLYPVQHGAGAFKGPVANLDTDTPTALPADVETLAEALQRNGFVTRGFSAHPWFKPGFGLDQGFADMLFTGGQQALTGHLLDWVEGLGTKQRFFAYLHLMEVHDRHRADGDEVRARIAGYGNERRRFLKRHANPAMCGKPGGLRCARSQAYMAAVLDLRENLAVLLAALERDGRLDSTVVALFSDHGEEFREHRDQHRALYEDPRGMYGVGHGQSHFRELLHVPLVMWRPGVTGAEHPGLASLVDVFPTVLEWLAVDQPDYELPGRVLPSGDQATESGSPVVYASNIAFGPESIAVVSTDAKALYWPGEDRFVFFDLEADPAELQALESDALLVEFSTLAGDYLELARVGRAEAPKLGRDAIEELKAIGYLQGVEDNENTDEDEP